MTLKVRVEKTGQEQFRAATSQPIALSAEADTAANAVVRLDEAIENQLTERPIVERKTQSSQQDHPWLKYAGVWKEHPDFDAFQDAITSFRGQFLTF